METLLNVISNQGLGPFLILLSLFLAAFWYLSEPKGLPPGPRGLPIIGYLPFMGRKPHETFVKIGKKYGSVFRLYLGKSLVIVLNDFAAIKEAFINQAETFAGRPKIMFGGLEGEYNTAMATTDGEFFKDHRRFTLTLLRDCGFGKLSIEPRILEEINHFLLKVKEFNGKPADLRRLLSTSVANNICIMTFGKRFQYDDPDFKRMQQYMIEFGTTASSVSPLIFFPWLKHLPGASYMFELKDIHKITVGFQQYLASIADEHRKKHVDGQRDHYVSAYITEQKERVKKTGSVGTFKDNVMLNNIRVLMAAGTETTTSTILWGILYMMKHMDIQKRVQDELDSVIGQDRTPSWNDRLRTPYTEATLCEIQRKGNIIPINLPHRNMEECELFGYRIPKGTLIASNLGHILSDPELWGDPENFRPERFLTKGQIQRPEYFIPFSTGKRECLGESLARMELYLYFTTLMQHFTFKTPENVTLNLEGTAGFSHTATAFNTCAIPRHS